MGVLLALAAGPDGAELPRDWMGEYGFGSLELPTTSHFGGVTASHRAGILIGRFGFGLHGMVVSFFYIKVESGIRG